MTKQPRTGKIVRHQLSDCQHLTPIPYPLSPIPCYALRTLASLSILLSAATGAMLAKPADAIMHNHADMLHQSATTTEFRQVKQPLPWKIGVTAGGLALIGLELWWFLLNKPKAQSSNLEQGIQKLKIRVDGGYEPSRIMVKVGKPVQLSFFRQDPSGCLEKVLLPDFHIAADLPLNQETSVEFTPDQAGEYTFTCGMNMFHGVIKAEV